MDFSKENIEASEQADFAYADWYSRLPDERKGGASVKASVNRKLPAFAKLAVCVFEKLNTSDPAK